MQPGRRCRGDPKRRDAARHLRNGVLDLRAGRTRALRQSLRVGCASLTTGSLSPLPHTAKLTRSWVGAGSGRDPGTLAGLCLRVPGTVTSASPWHIVPGGGTMCHMSPTCPSQTRRLPQFPHLRNGKKCGSWAGAPVWQVPGGVNPGEAIAASTPSVLRWVAWEKRTHGCGATWDSGRHKHCLSGQ